MKPLLFVNEIFYSIQGEGLWAGQPAIFIRLSGCNLRCSFCDTKYDTFQEMSVDTIVSKVSNYPSPVVVITGGEPTIQPLQDLVSALKMEDFRVHLETNGTCRQIPEEIDWVTVSPKRLQDIPTMPKAQEIKYLYGIPDWEEIFNTLDGTRFFQWSGLQPINSSLEKPCLEYCLEHPWLRYSCQIHKKLGVR